MSGFGCSILCRGAGLTSPPVLPEGGRQGVMASNHGPVVIYPPKTYSNGYKALTVGPKP